MCVLLFNDFNGFSFKERHVKHLLLRKTDVLKTFIFSGRKFEEIQWFWRAERYKVYLGKFWHYFLQLSFVYKTLSQIYFNFFCSGIKGFYQSSLGNEVEFTDIMNVSPNILNKKQHFKKLRHSFVGEGAMITMTLISSCHWKTLIPFCLQKKRPENAFLTLTWNYRKIVRKNKLCHSKQQ